MTKQDGKLMAGTATTGSMQRSTGNGHEPYIRQSFI